MLALLAQKVMLSSDRMGCHMTYMESTSWASSETCFLHLAPEFFLSRSPGSCHLSRRHLVDTRLCVCVCVPWVTIPFHEGALCTNVCRFPKAKSASIRPPSSYLPANGQDLRCCLTEWLQTPGKNRWPNFSLRPIRIVFLASVFSDFCGRLGCCGFCAY